MLDQSLLREMKNRLSIEKALTSNKGAPFDTHTIYCRANQALMET